VIKAGEINVDDVVVLSESIDIFREIRG
jgi:hypothetical protein